MFEVVEGHKLKLEGCDTLCELRTRQDTGDLYANTGAFFERLRFCGEGKYSGREGRMWTLIDGKATEEGSRVMPEKATTEFNVAQLIDRATAQERERCAKIADEEAERRFDNDDEYPAARVHDFMVVARSIAKAIRGTTSS